MRSILDYVLERPIGTGDGTVVHRARRLPGDELVAIKMAAPGLTTDELEQVEQQIRHEADVLGRATHPALVPFVELIDGGIDPGEGCAPVALVLGLASRGSLHDRLSTGGGLAPGEVVAIGVALAGAVAALHAVGIVHGDISTGNVLLDEDRGPWLADLGDAGVGGRATRARGTDGFAAPEVTAGQPPGQAADIHALGRVLRAALGPIDAEGEPGDQDETGDRIIGDRPAGSLHAILARATDPDPEARPPAAVMTLELSRLAEVLGGPTTGAAAVTRDFGAGRPLALARPAVSSSRPRRRSAALIAGGGAVVVVITVGLILGFATSHPTAGPVDPAAALGPDPVTGDRATVDRPPCPGPGPAMPAGAVAVAGDPTGRGCLVAMTWWPDRAEVERPDESGERTRFTLGDPGDQFLLGDWDGDGRDTPGLYRPATGQVTRFDGWAGSGRSVTGSMVAGDRPRDGIARVERRAGGDHVAVDQAPGGT